ncbi:unnamed protein product [Phytophthora fragariaefolia]|uniref:Unnamed protein product n=1 Tax=Phytophthora fragariaefolia TaxID=1490495 RepID=A0A9W6X0E3_9STRA|nr:unnamed protein product [Phytophthora fragariaefolia]
MSVYHVQTHNDENRLCRQEAEPIVVISTHLELNPFSRGKSPLVVLTGRQNSDDYVYTVSECLLHFAHLNYGVDDIYQQDNASLHTSKRTREFFTEEDIKVLDWPSKSPDLNPIENLWSIMSRRVYPNGKQYESVPQLKAALFEA